MNQYKSNRELKAMARDVLLGKYGVAVVATLVLNAISTICTFLVMLVSNPFSKTGLILYYLMLVVISVVIGIFQVGFQYLYLNIVRNRPFQVTDIFYGYRRHADKSILVYLISFGIGVVCMLPYLFFVILALVRRETSFFIPGLLFGLAGLAASYYFGLCFSQVLKLLVDFPELTCIELYRKSMEMMRGHKKRLFILSLSFIGWLLLSLLSCGVAFLWVGPYMQTAMAYFYLDLTGELSRPRPDVIPAPQADYYV